eukprot:scaffold14464_cov108-Isochrysis_galbana.AAC.1
MVTAHRDRGLWPVRTSRRGSVPPPPPHYQHHRPKSQHNTHNALFALGPRPVLSYTAVGLVPPGA